MSDVGIFINYSERVVRLPVNPKELEISSSSNNDKESLVHIGDITVLQKPGLESLTIKSFLPTTPDPPYVLTKGAFEDPKFYIDFFNEIRQAEESCRLVITGLENIEVNMQVSVEDFSYSVEGGTDDVDYKLELKKYVPYTVATTVVPKPTTPTAPTTSTSTATATKTSPVTPPVNSSFSIGDKVIANGKYWYNSYGARPYGTFSNFTGKITNIVRNPGSGQNYCYHIATLSGGWRGWVAKSQIRHA